MQQSKRIYNVAESIKDGTIKGKFVDDRKKFEFEPVKNIDAKNNESTWTISISAFDTEKDKNIRIDPVYYTPPILSQPPKNIITKIYVTIKRHTGHVQTNEDTIVEVGKNLGKANATTPISQAFVEAYRKWFNKNKMANKKSADSLTQNVRPFPMLLKKTGVTKKATLNEEDFKRGVIVQPKLDGIRTVAHMLSDQTIEFYSRKGLAFTGLENIIAEVCQMIIGQNEYKDTEIYLDGEIFINDVPLQEISGAIRGENNKLKEKLEFHVFDCFIIDKELTQKERLDLIKKMYKKKFKYVKLVPTIIVHNQKNVDDIYKKFIDEGFEGAITRRLDGLYRFGIGSQRSSDVLKIKPYNTDEFEIVNYKEGRGKDKGAVTFVLKTDKGIEFSAVPNATLESRKALFKKFEDDETEFNKNYRGKMATIQYADLSKDNVPTQPKYVSIRID
uniref:ATP-dependent DNA ligase family profile domain-containing protein n=1 Tax=viral metagenome TaxID=1070528 RepID=A0A6C0LLD4_9ZZZZ